MNPGIKVLHNNLVRNQNTMGKTVLNPMLKQSYFNVRVLSEDSGNNKTYKVILNVCRLLNIIVRST